MQRIGRPKREKLFGQGRCVPLDRNTKVRIMTFARARMRRDAPGRHWGSVTAKAMAVMEALLWAFHNSRSGLAIPSYETIASRAGCARSTVALAIKALERAGILTWCIRLRRVRVPSPSGWRWRVLRSSNSYRFTVLPDVPILRVSSKSEDRTETTNQASLSIVAPGRRGFDTDDSPLAAALARFGDARLRSRLQIPATAT